MTQVMVNVKRLRHCEYGVGVVYPDGPDVAPCGEPAVEVWEWDEETNSLAVCMEHAELLTEQEANPMRWEDAAQVEKYQKALMEIIPIRGDAGAIAWRAVYDSEAPWTTEAQP